MIKVEAEKFAEDINQYLLDSRSDTIVIMQAGKPCAVLRGIDYDEEDMQLVCSQEFWSMIRASRQSPTIPWDTAIQRLSELDE
jgi:hypothetical protein